MFSVSTHPNQKNLVDSWSDPVCAEWWSLDGFCVYSVVLPMRTDEFDPNGQNIKTNGHNKSVLVPANIENEPFGRDYTRRPELYFRPLPHGQGSFRLTFIVFSLFSRQSTSGVNATSTGLVVLPLTP